MPLMRGDEACRKIRLFYDKYNNSKSVEDKIKFLSEYQELEELEQRRLTEQQFGGN